MIWIMVLQWIGTYLEFNAWGMSFLPTSGTLQMVSVVHIQCWHYDTTNFTLLHGTEYFCFSMSFVLLSFGWARRHGFWNQVVRAAFRILNSVISGTFCRSPARSKSPNASVSFLHHIEVHLLLFFLILSAKISMQPPPNGEAASPKKQNPSRSPSGSRSPDVKCSSFLICCSLIQ